MSMETIILLCWWMIIPLGIIGSILHFLFDWTNHNRFIALFSAVNESYWEHIKIAVWPVVILQVVLFAFGGFQYPSFIPSATISLYAIPISMVALVFLYKSLTKRNVLWLDIFVFFAVIALSQVIFILMFEQLSASIITVVISALFYVGILASFLRFTLIPPREPDMFEDPLNKKYGLRAHPDLFDNS